MNDETKKYLQKLESDLSALRIILDSQPHEGRHAEAQAAFRVARLTFDRLVDAIKNECNPDRFQEPQTIEELAEAQGVAPAKLENIVGKLPEMEIREHYPLVPTLVGATVRDALDRAIERIVREVLGQ